MKNPVKSRFCGVLLLPAQAFGGERGIRTLGTPKGSTVFETAPIDHSGISPEYNNFANQIQALLPKPVANIQFQTIPDCLKSR